MLHRRTQEWAVGFGGVSRVSNWCQTRDCLPLHKELLFLVQVFKIRHLRCNHVSDAIISFAAGCVMYHR
jgi:hypothetical protein